MSSNGQQYEMQGWSLAELFDELNSPEIEAQLSVLEETVSEFEAFRPKLSPDLSEETFSNLISLHEKIIGLFNRIYGFASLSFSTNTQDQQVQAFLGRMGQIAAQAQNRILFFSLWWKDLDSANAERLAVSTGELAYWLARLRATKPFTLTEVEEKVVNIKDANGTNALQRLHSTISNRYKFELQVDGEVQSVNREQLSVRFRSADPEERAAAYQELFRVYSDDAVVLGQIYQALVRDWRAENVELRGYDSPIAVRNRANDIPDAVVETMLDVVRKNAGIFHRFFALKAKWLGLEKLRRYDLYAPVVKSKVAYTFNEAVHLVLESFNEFDSNISRLAKRVLDDAHYDSEVRDGKRGGAFCATLGPSYTPWVLQTFTGEARDVATMAHELGHAVHSMLAEDHSILIQQSTLPLAETASTFGEMLLLDKLLASNTDEELERDLLFSTMDDAYATIMRQAYFAAFEVEAHEAIHNNASVDELSNLYLKLLREQFGDAMDVSEDFRNEWVAIPHFFSTPFYVYAYAFGQLLALALYKQYKEEGDSMIPRYVEILAAGGSQAPVDILRRAGIDIYSADFWQGGFDYLAEQLAHLEALPLPAAA